MKVEVRVPYPLIVAEKEERRLVIFLERPWRSFETENAWPLLHLRGICLIDDKKLVKQIVLPGDVTVVVTSFEPRPARVEPEEALTQLLGGEGPCPKVNLGGGTFIKCGEVLLSWGWRELPPLGFGVVRTRIDVIGARLRLKA